MFRELGAKGLFRSEGISLPEPEALKTLLLDTKPLLALLEPFCVLEAKAVGFCQDVEGDRGSLPDRFGVIASL